MYTFRASPAFSLSKHDLEDGNNHLGTISCLCEWAMYFRKRLHLQRNWNKGIYNINKLQFPAGDDLLPLIINDSYCDGRLLVTGTCSGHVLIWSIEGL
jgi:hypothetical protein